MCPRVATVSAWPAYLRFPHLRGDTLVFVAEDDVWTAPVSGGRAYRLTADDVPVGTPRLSPDGSARGVDVVRARARRRSSSPTRTVGPRGG